MNLELVDKRELEKNYQNLKQQKEKVDKKFKMHINNKDNYEAIKARGMLKKKKRKKIKLEDFLDKKNNNSDIKLNVKSEKNLDIFKEKKVRFLNDFNIQNEV